MNIQSLTLKENTISIIRLHVYKHVVEIPTNKRAYSYKLKLSKKRNLFLKTVYRCYTACLVP